MVYQISKKKWNQEVREEFQGDFKKLSEIKKIFLEGIDKDVKIFTDNQKLEFKDPEQLKEMIEVPLKIAENAVKALEISIDIKDYIKKTITADYDVAVINLRACIKGALSIIESNYNFYSEDSTYLNRIKAKVDSLKLI